MEIGNKVFVPAGMKLNGAELEKGTWIRVIDSGHVVGYDVETSVQLPGETETTLVERFGKDVNVKLPKGAVLGNKTLTEATWIRVEKRPESGIVIYDVDTSVQLPGETETTLVERFGENVYVKLLKGTKLNGIELQADTWVYIKPVVGYDVNTSVQLPNETATTLVERFGENVYVKLPAGTILNYFVFGGGYWTGVELAEDTWIRVEKRPESGGVCYDESTSVQLPNETATTLGERFGWDVAVQLPAGTVLNGGDPLKSDTAVYIVSPYTVGYGSNTRIGGHDNPSVTLGSTYGKNVYVKIPEGTTWEIYNGSTDIHVIFLEDTWIRIEEKPAEEGKIYERQPYITLSDGTELYVESGVWVKLPAGTMVDGSPCGQQWIMWIDLHT